MTILTRVMDSLTNLVANLGTSRDKASSSAYGTRVLTAVDLINAYRFAWLPRKIIEAPAQDATRKWRAWQGNKDQIEKIEGEEKRLGVANKLEKLMIEARLRGGAALYIGTDQKPDTPLRMGQKGFIKYLVLMSRDDLSPSDFVNDPLDPRFGMPTMWRVGGSSNALVHPSRLITMVGNELPRGPGIVQDGWGDPVLSSIYDAVMNSDATMANVASMVFEAKVDILRIPDFMDNVGDPAYRAKVLERGVLAGTTKGINGMLMLDKEEEYETKQLNFGGLPDIIDRFMQAVSGAADMPATRLWGQAPKGMSATGESDTRNYYDRVQSDQNMKLSPALTMLDEALIYSALGSRPASIYYVWNSLWQTTDKERADIGKTIAETFKTMQETGLITPDVLAKAAITTLIESNAMPGLEQAEEEDVSDTPEPVAITDAAPRTLYVRRDVLNVGDFQAWAKSQGLTIGDKGGPLHVTIAHSSTPVDWIKMGSGWENDEQGHMVVPPGGPRVMEVIGKGANALHFASSALSYRNEAMREAGAGWDFEDYSPHITINYDPSVDLSKVEPYRGKIVFGPEIFEELK